MLTKEQIDYLFQFCLDQRVYYYEIQAELVDHLANAVEAEMAGNSALSFEIAVEQVFDRFGVWGFSPIVRQQTKQMTRSVRRQYCDFMRAYRNSSQWLQSLAVAAILFFTIELTGIVGMCIFFSVFFIWILKDMLLRFQARKEVKKSGKEFWKTRHFFEGESLGAFLLMVLFSFDRGGFLADYHIGACIFSIMLYDRLRIGPTFVKWLKDSLRNGYPRVFGPALSNI